MATAAVQKTDDRFGQFHSKASDDLHWPGVSIGGLYSFVNIRTGHQVILNILLVVFSFYLQGLGI
jgi:hypothetical protein